MTATARPATSVNIAIGGAAGQGLQTIETILARLLKSAGSHVFATKEFMSRIRGGCNSVTIRTGCSPLTAYAEQIDIGVLLNHDAYRWLKPRLHDDSILIGDREIFPDSTIHYDLPLTQLSDEIGGKLYGNAFASGFLAGHLGLDLKLLEAVLQEVFGEDDAEQLQKNLAAARLGGNLGAESALETGGGILAPDCDARVARSLFVNGTQAVALGALAGGCNFISSYPMSPSTGVLHFLAAQAERFGVVVEQAEDEISAVNMALGSWYAGGRALVTTSGGGLALMMEGISLAGCIESPLVIHLAQRPGPATGLPTRTEQGDLELALYAGHGEFPRVLLAPGSLEDAFRCGQQAFALADRFQMPVFVLTDQYLLDSYHDLEALPLPSENLAHHVVGTPPDYKRYALSDDGLSPRGIPGFGEGLVCVDSDEHDEEGLITELAEVRRCMVDKRLKKMEAVRDHAGLEVELYGAENFTRLIVGWGSTRNVVREALEQVGNGSTAFLYSPQIYPLPSAFVEYLRRAQRVIVIENNATGQFARLLQREASLRCDASWLQYDGRPFSVERVAELIREEVKDDA